MLGLARRRCENLVLQIGSQFRGHVAALRLSKYRREGQYRQLVQLLAAVKLLERGLAEVREN